MVDEIDYENSVMTQYPSCSLGFRMINSTLEVDYVSPESSLYGLFQVGDRVTNYRLLGDENWHAIEHFSDTHGGPLGSKLELLVTKQGSAETIILAGTRFPFMEIRDLTYDKRHLVISYDYEITNCDALLSGITDVQRLGELAAPAFHAPSAHAEKMLG